LITALHRTVTGFQWEGKATGQGRNLNLPLPEEAFPFPPCLEATGRKGMGKGGDGP